MSNNVEQHSFQAETRQLLDLMIHSLYTNKEIFLRELISNGSDALDRLRFEALTDPEIMGDDDQLEIRLDTDADGRTLTIRDTGIGMSREEVISNIGTIARSGSRELMEKIRESATTDVGELIGQFGVGFYSSFMVAERVTLVTRRAGGDHATRWESTGDGTFSLTEADKADRGTEITLHLKPADKDAGLDDFTDQWALSRIVKRYSDFVTYPIIHKQEREESELDAGGKPKEGGKTATVLEDKTLNSMKPIWTRPEDEVTDDEYGEFYKHIAHDWNEPIRRVRLRAEGRIEYQALLFVPAEAPHDLYYFAYEYGLQLYVRRVMIMDRCEDLLPRYLRFVKGVVDSDDLPLNISRQRLQEDRHITQIRKWLTKKILDTLAEMKSSDEGKYLEFWEHFGKAIKEGLSSDFDNKDKLLQLVLFETSNDPEKRTTLAEYVERMPEDQEQIFYLTGESRTAVENSPHLEAFQDKSIEVLYLTDPVDELVVQHLFDFEGKKLKSIGKGTVELGSQDEKEKAKKDLEAKQEEHKDLLELLQKKLDATVKQVRFTNRLTASPACLVGADHDYSPQLEKLLQKGKGGGPQQRWILEINPEHEIVRQLEARFETSVEDPLIGDYGELLVGYAQLAEGTEIPDPVRFNQLLSDVMVARLQTPAGSAAAKKPAAQPAAETKKTAKKPAAKKPAAKKPAAKPAAETKKTAKKPAAKKPAAKKPAAQPAAETKKTAKKPVAKKSSSKKASSAKSEGSGD